MTDEQRKQFIEEQIKIFPADCEMGEFLRDMAKLQPCEAAISRQAVLDMCKKEIDHISKNWLNYHSPSEAKSGFAYIATNIYELPSVKPQESKWIPVSERLPSDYEYVILSVLDDYGDTPWRYTTVAWLCNGVWISNNDILCDTAVAWMPLPQPYVPDTNDGKMGESEE